MRKTQFLVLLLTSTLAAAAQSFSVSDTMTITSSAGEAQATVVPPGLKTQCKEGRFLVTNDRKRPPGAVVSGRDLGQTAGAPVPSTFSMGTLASDFNPDVKNSNYLFGTNDHDLVTLPNGDVLYITGAFSRMPVNPPPPKRPLPIQTSTVLGKAFRAGICVKKDAAGNCIETHDFGPNARSVVLVFRSTDCGQNFGFISEMDPLRFGGATCGLPQFRKKAGCTTGDCRDTSEPYDMGGSDGQLVKVDPANNKVYLIFQCVGYNIGGTGKDPILDPNSKINKTLVMMSDTSGGSWKFLGYIDVAAWRFSVIPAAGGLLNFGYKTSVLNGKKDKKGSYTFDSKGVPAPTGTVNWGFWKNFEGTSVPLVKKTGDVVKKNANIFAQPVVARMPGSNGVVLAFPEKFGRQGFGYRVFFYGCERGKMAEADPILPSEPAPENVAFHLTVADPGAGPVLLYWTDLDSSANKATVLGKFITGPCGTSEKFTVSLSGKAEHTFHIPENTWMGDYHTAGAHIAKRRPNALGTPGMRYDFYPMWVEGDGQVHYAKVEYSVEPELLSSTPKFKAGPLKVLSIPRSRWKRFPRPVELRLLGQPLDELTLEEDIH